MEKKPLIIIGNEKVFKSDSSFYCDRYDEKSIPEGLSKYNEIYYIARSLNKKGDHKVNLKNIKLKFFLSISFGKSVSPNIKPIILFFRKWCTYRSFFIFCYKINNIFY